MELLLAPEKANLTLRYVNRENFSQGVHKVDV
jgi:hypothetical protein